MVRECDTWMQPQLHRWQEKCWCADILVRSSLPRAVDLPPTARFIRSVAHAWTPAADEINRKAAATRQGSAAMKALVYDGPREVHVKDVPDARIENPTDVLVKITSTNICGSDLHMYEGRTDLEPGMVLGHENLGIVAEVGNAVVKVSPGDRVCLPFNIGCGFCRNCEEGLTAFCLTVHPDPKMAGAAFGFAGMGPFWGGQAEYLRVPFGDFNCLRLPEDAQDKETDYVMLSDIFPTGWHCTRLADMQPGDSMVVYGAGPVGLMAAYSAMIQGASKVMIVDRHPDRLRLAEEHDCR